MRCGGPKRKGVCVSSALQRGDTPSFLSFFLLSLPLLSFLLSFSFFQNARRAKDKTQHKVCSSQPPPPWRPARAVPGRSPRDRHACRSSPDGRCPTRGTRSSPEPRSARGGGRRAGQRTNDIQKESGEDRGGRGHQESRRENRFKGERNQVNDQE